MEDIKKGVDQGKIVIGKNLVLKRLKKGELSKVVFSISCDPLLKKEIADLAEGATLKNSKLSSKDLGAFAKKNFGISVLGVLK